MKETKRGKKERITVMLLICNTVQLCALYNSLLSLQEKVVFLLNGHKLLMTEKIVLNLKGVVFP